MFLFLAVLYILCVIRSLPQISLDNDNNDKFSASLKPTYMDPAGRCYIVTADGVKLENKRERRFQHLLNTKNWLMIIFIILSSVLLMLGIILAIIVQY